MGESPEWGETTRMIRASEAGDPEAKRLLMAFVYEDLRRLAHRLMRSEDREHTLQPTALVNEWMLKVLAEEKGLAVENRQHLLSTAARAMRHLLVDRARARNSEKRGRGEFYTLAPEVEGNAIGPERLLLIHDALDRLAELDPRKARVAELRTFGGFTVAEIAEALSVTPRTVDRDWLFAKAWLHNELRGRSGGRAAHAPPDAH